MGIHVDGYSRNISQLGRSPGCAGRLIDGLERLIRLSGQNMVYFLLVVFVVGAGSIKGTRIAG